MEKLYAFLQKKVKKKILIAPLDWGLGHASRCIPIIQHCLERDMEVYLASSGDAGLLLQKEFPNLPYFSLPSYNIQYHSRTGLILGIIKQIPDIMHVINMEHQLLVKINNKHHFDIILSDNRYGLWDKNTHCIFMTHQLGIRIPYFHFLLASAARKFHYRFINKFQYCWIPDHQGDNNLSGELSHGFQLPKNTVYIGPLSRMTNTNINRDQSSHNNSVLIILSGPEPQRTRLEEILIQQALKIDRPFILIRGKMEEEVIWKQENNIKIISYLTSYQIINEFQSAELVICRSGYSSIMDLAVCGKNAVLIPTPEQTEQEYLANYHKKHGNYYSESQNNFNLERCLNNALLYKGLQIDTSSELLDVAFKNIIGEL